jgi:hypothetical protein
VLFLLGETSLLGGVEETSILRAQGVVHLLYQHNHSICYSGLDPRSLFFATSLSWRVEMCCVWWFRGERSNARAAAWAMRNPTSNIAILCQPTASSLRE